jgi:S1-C subfamily serine protease
MITILFSTARKCALACSLAVLFAAPISAGDSSMVRFEDRINELIYSASRSVVTVEAIRTNMPGAVTAPGQEAVHSLVASGVIYDSIGHIIVAATSVIDRDQFMVEHDGSTLDARLCGIDYRNGLAVLSVGRQVGVPVRLAVGSRCAGQMVIALGNAYGVSAAPSIGFCAGYRPDGSMQFSATITSGTIGGGLFDLEGNLIGIITGGIGDDRWSEAGLALAANELTATVDYLAHNGDRYAGYIGIRISDVDITRGIEINYPPALVAQSPTPGRIVDQGVMVTSVIPGSPAAKAGLQPGDLLFSINGVAVNSAARLQHLVRDNSPGSVLEIGFVRHNTPYVIQFEVGRLDDNHLRRNFGRGSSEPAPPVDSLIREIDSLKRTLLRLEDRVRNMQ